jgi:RNA polymerase sigma-54 factor
VSFALEMTMAPTVGLEVSPAQVAFSELLMMPWTAMQAAVERELCTNSALERLDAGDCPLCRNTWGARCPACSPPSRRSAGSSPGRVADPGDRGAPESDAAALGREVLLEIPASEAPVAECLVDSLDEHGLLDRPCAEIAADLGVTEATVERVLQVVRRCGPPGVGASSLTECLLLQLDALEPADPEAPLARRVIADHLPALGRGHLASIARALGVSRTDIERVLALVRDRLRPYPAYDGNVPAVSSYVVPDVVVRESDDIAGAFTVELVEPSVTRLGVRAPSGSAEASRARSFLGQLRDRWDTLRRVADFAVERQREFLRDGPTALKPLTRAEAAAALDLHESTVSRAVADKFALLPDMSIVPLARFFGVSGGLDGELRRLLESAEGPMSDQRLADRLREAGYPVARRTVAKHRARLGFTATSLA